MSTPHVAIIGMGCRFPGASSPEQFWDNLVHGVESVTFFGPVTPTDAGYEVHAAGILDDVAGFDAALFGLSAREAERMDPQHRVWLECAWEAAERAGYDPRRLPGRTGIFAGAGFNEYLIRNLVPSALHDDLSLLLSNEPSFLPSRLAYLLGCTGPAVSVSSACSTSLVAVHLAVQALLADECDTAIAGGVRITTPQRRPYRHEPGGIGSPDGHCRAFDREANGTVGGNGAGAVVLRRLDDALADGDPVAAVILGSAVSNDGARRVGFTAPGVDGQRCAIREAQVLADVPPDSIGMIEAHGTATALGDPVEFEALAAAFRQGTARQGFCALGSVKTNIGHLDAAAGIAGLIKTVLALQHRVIPPSLHFHEPNPRIDLANSPFFVNAAARPWPDATRRAGVSSFGMGGTNAHLVLESAAEPQPDAAGGDAGGPWPLLLSARSEAAVRRLARDLADHLERERPPLADVAYTLAMSRGAFEWRIACECASLDEAIEILRGDLPVTRAAAGAAAVAARGRRGALPPTPFEHQRYWIDPPSPLARVADPGGWLYAPRLRQSAPLERAPIDTRRHWLVLLDEHGVGARVATRLREAGAQVAEIAYADEMDAQAIDAAAAAAADRPSSVIALWGLAAEPARDDDSMLKRHYIRPARLLRAWADRTGADVDVTFVADGALAAQAGFGAPAAPEKAMLLGLARALPAEYPGRRARVADVDAAAADLVECIVAEACARSADDAAIHRHGSRWVETLEPIGAATTQAMAIRRDGVYLVTGGNSGMGRAIGRHLVERGARVVALSRRGGQSIPGLTAIAVDVSDLDALRRAVAQIRAEHGPINGVVHSAGMPPHALLRTAADTAMRDVLAGKFLGARNLRQVLCADSLDFVVLCSSLRAHVPAAGASDYMAANLALEALGASWAADGTRVRAIAWDTWTEIGMATVSDERFVPEDLRTAGLSADEGVRVLEMASACGSPRIAVSTRKLDPLKARAREAFSLARAADAHQPAAGSRHPRPVLAVPYVPARTALEARLATIWSDVLGFEPIGVIDDFFDLGGDSVATLQIVARAKEQGIHLDTHLAFGAHTIEELAAAGVERTAQAVPRETPLPLSPTQQWLFNCGSGDINRFVQGVVLSVPAEIDATALGTAIDAAIAHHAALAARFEQTESGWKQVLGTPAPVVVAVHQHSGPADEQLGFAQEIGAALQCSLDIRTSPLLRAALVLGTAGSMLVLVVHHLLIDAFSWRRLLGDLHGRVGASALAAGQQRAAADESFFHWAIALERVAAAGELDDDAAFWSSLDTPPDAFPVARRDGVRRALNSTLPVAQTLALSATRRPLEALLAVAVARAIRSVGESDRVPVDIESFGRGWSRVPCDVSSAIGWFTAIHPLVVDTSADIEAAATHAAALLPDARRRAVAYTVLRQAAPERLPKALRSDAPISIAFFPAESAAPAWPIAAILSAPEQTPAPHAIALAATIEDGALRIVWHGQDEPFAGLTLDTIAARAMNELRALATAGTARMSTILAQLDMSEATND
ncbi:type I polyketide synthase [Burkholderia thailandensis]|uniref:type I polyketide synthase n=1 Tax=Burkholderia thailandensis TaxID=57975 RepID=UPI002D76D04D|nr:SDR family NAD(P)-dependent oxidoreductase [Burkholderia thailandensis]WRS64321.1 SDR family NAD(P)-dependent oxidoreductase [Burkholderia thailandensis]